MDRVTGMMCLCMGIGSKLWTKQAPPSCRQISLLRNSKHVIFLYAGDFPLAIIAVMYSSFSLRFLCAPPTCVCNKYACQIHTVFTSALKMDVFREFTRTDFKRGRRK